MRPESLSNRELVSRCIANDDAEMWSEFISRTRRLVAGVVFRVAARWNESRPEVLEELVQETYLHLFSNNRQVLRQFEPVNDDAIFGFLKVVTANVTHDHLRAQNAGKRGAHLTESAEEGVVEIQSKVQLGAPPKAEEQLLLSEIEAWLNRLVSGRDAENHKTIFWLYYRQGMSASNIAQIQIFGLTTKGVESVIYRLTRLLEANLSLSRGTGTAGLARSKGTGEA